MVTESHNIEFKEIYVNDIKKEAVAFVNTDGGTIFIGINNNGTVSGVDNVDEVMLQVTSALRDAIKPDIMPFVQIKPEQLESKSIVRIDIVPGTNKPYYLSEKGLKPSGVYVRRGSASQPLSDEGIREMIISTSGKTYETGRSLNQELSFVSFAKAMQERSLQTGEAQFRTLNLIGEDGLYTNLALLLSDQCEHSIKVAVFQGGEKAIFKNRKEFNGSLLKQLEEVYELIDMHNNNRSTFSGLYRIDKRDYPQEAIREALLNCIVHRDYSFSGSTLINIYDDRIEFVSLGGLVAGLTMEAIYMGVSQSRNPKLAAVFYRMELIESYGTGIDKIQRSYSECSVKPVFESAQGAFRVILPNINENTSVAQSQDNAEPKAIILAYAKKNGAITRSEAEDLTGLKTTATHKLLKELCVEKKLLIKKSGKNTKYILV